MKILIIMNDIYLLNMVVRVRNMVGSLCSSGRVMTSHIITRCDIPISLRLHIHSTSIL